MAVALPIPDVAPVISAVFFIFDNFYRRKIRKKGEAKIFLLLFCQLPIAHYRLPTALPFRSS